MNSYERSWLELFKEHGKGAYWIIETNMGKMRGGRFAGIRKGLVYLDYQKDGEHRITFINPRRISAAERFLPVVPKPGEKPSTGETDTPETTSDEVGEGMFKCPQCGQVKALLEQYKGSDMCWICWGQLHPETNQKPVETIEADEVLNKDGEKVT